MAIKKKTVTTKKKVTKKAEPEKKKINLPIWIAFAFLTIALGAMTYAYYQESHRELTPEEIATIQKSETSTLLAQVGKHIILPTDTQPVIATVMDPAGLKKDSSFFDLAKKGNKVIIYSDKAILFDPEADIIVNVAPVQLPTPESNTNLSVDGATDNSQQVEYLPTDNTVTDNTL